MVPDSRAVSIDCYLMKLNINVFMMVKAHKYQSYHLRSSSAAKNVVYEIKNLFVCVPVLSRRNH